jgi:hypothetical protein
MITTRIRATTRLFIATISLAAVALALVAAPAAGAAGLRNCVDVAGPQSGRAGCYEDVWADGTQYRLTFSNTRFTGATPKVLDAFYVLAPQTDSRRVRRPTRSRTTTSSATSRARTTANTASSCRASSSSAAVGASSAAPASRPGRRSVAT